MKLKSMFLHGFKSFARPTRLNFADGITVIVGPNGGGKSNIVDAVRWVFGEQSMKQLRADEKSDVIFAGSASQPAAQSAYVELVFENENETISVARQLTADGKNTYFLNGQPARLKDIREKFEGTGIGVEFYSIVGQGQIERIISSSPEELRVLLEEAADIHVYKERKKEALENLERVQNNLLRVSDVINELDRQRKSLYLKAKRAERYKEYSQKLAENKRIYYGNILKRETRRLNYLNEELSKTFEKIKQLQKDLVEVETNWSTLKAEFASVDKEIENFTNLLEDYKRRQTTLSELREMYNKRLSEREGKYVETTTKLDSIQERIAQIEKRISELSLILKGLIEEISQKEAELSQIEKQRDEILSKYTEKEKQFLGIREKLEALHKERISLEGELSRIEESVEDLSKRISIIDSQLDVKVSRLSRLQTELSLLLEKLKNAGDKEAQLVKELQTIRERIDELTSEKRAAEDELENVRRTLRLLDEEEARIKQRIESYEGYTKAVRAIFAKKAEGYFENVHDVVANLISFPSEYAKAVEVLLGGAVQNVVVEASNTAKEVIEWLNREKIGRVTFLPLDLIESHFSGLRDVESHKGFVGYAAQIVRVPEKYAVLPGFLFGNDIIVRTLEDAIDIKKKYKVRCRIVTLNGELIGQHGSITGGEVETERSDTLVRRKLRLAEISEQRVQLLSHEKQLQQKLSKIQEEVQALYGQEKIAERELTNVIAEGSSTKRMVEELSKTAQEMDQEISSLQQLKKNYHLRIEGMRARKDTILSRLDEISKEKENLELLMKEYDEKLAAERKTMEEILSKHSEVKTRLASLMETKLHYESELDKLKKDKEKLSEESLVLNNQARELEKEINKLKELLLENQRELEALRKESESLFEAMRLQRADKDQKLATLAQLEEKMQKMKEERERLRDQQHQLELTIQEVKSKIEQCFTQVDPQEVENVEEIDNETLELVKKEMEDLETKLKYLGPVDLTSIQEYEDVEKKYNELVIQKKDLEDAKAKILELIEKTDEEARNKFLDVYERVNANFNKFISILFPGAEGEIRLQSGKDLLETGIELSVRKPGRKVQKLQLLSGGEKALVSIALIFALLEIKPSPFYLLDEVDAPLDDFSAERLKNLLEISSSKTQFIVITHNKVIMEAAKMLHGVTMVDGVSCVVPVELETVVN
ncbi:chromosome segregation protein SMC [Pseudothermotoga thermarum]|uniref:Chromosome partition protein Smc n=1 Tax=Pseudothermotoga thermarum DSM 5069 TaxID=688269 RepID=F7YWM4_9THEM|nr:chromosome segregation protein SMC [Pseudothermotoga thermarum]AEH52009.1 chromosome segregation protein SMC [Pseudothermotoga thermarum DSM 5069]